MIHITLFTTAGCHLCDVAEELLKQLSQRHNIKMNKTEIGDNDQLVNRYGTVIPVLKFADNSELNWPFELSDIINRINSL